MINKIIKTQYLLIILLLSDKCLGKIIDLPGKLISKALNKIVKKS
jgi:hypothetical protein